MDQREIDTAWLAGLLEGEGYFGISTGRKQRLDGSVGVHEQIKVELNMTDLDVLERAREIIGTGNWVKLKKYRDHHTQAYGLRVTKAADVIALCRRVYPYMGKRKKQRIDAMYASHEAKLAKRRPAA